MKAVKGSEFPDIAGESPVPRRNRRVLASANRAAKKRGYRSDVKRQELRPVVTYPRDAIVETAHIAAALGVSRDVVGTMDLPCFYPGAYPRYIWGQVLDELTHRANADATPQPITRRRRRAS